MADPFGRGGSSGGGGGSSSRSDPFNRGGGTKKKHGHGGLLGIIEHTGSDLYHAAVNTPAGVVALGKGLATHPIKTVEDTVKATAHDLRHPLRHPGYTLLDLWGLASAGAGTAARLGAVGKALEEGGSVGKALLHAPKPGVRAFEHEGVKVESRYSGSPLTALAQKAADKAREARPAANAKRVGRELRKQERIVGGIDRGPASALIAAGKSLNAAQQTALRVVAEGVTVSDRLATHEADLAKASGRTARRLQRKIDLLHGAGQYLDETGGEPRIAAGHTKLERIYQKLEDVSHDREDLLTKVGDLTPEAVEERLHGPGRVFKGATYETPTPAKAGKESAGLKRLRRRVVSLQGRIDRVAQDVVEHRFEKGRTRALAEPEKARRLSTLRGALSVAKDELAVQEGRAAKRVKPTGLVGAEDFRGGKVYIPHGPDTSGVRGTLHRAPQVGANDVIGQPRPLASTRKPLTGGAIHAGTFGDKATEQVGRSTLEAHKLGALLRIRDALEPAIKAAPASEHDILIRRNGLKANEPLPGIARELREKLDLGARLTADEERQVQGAFERLRAHLLPTTSSHPLSPEAEAELQRHFEEGKIGFVDRRLLGGLDKPQPRLEQFIGTRGAKVFDATNNASRAAILYLKPAYALPNLLGNATLNVLQQGFAAPYELTRSLRLARDTELAARVDEVMGEGFSQALAGDRGAGTKAIQAAANFWGRGVDRPFRRASFLYEARKAGYKTSGDLRKLLTDEAHRGDLLQVSRKANDAIIDYANLNPLERAVIARVVFFYPWVKGSTTYAGQFVADHPVEAMIAAQVGRMGKETSDRELGALPSYLEGLIPLGKTKDGNATVLNPSSAAIFQTPAQVGAGIAGIFTGDKRAVAQLTNFTTPAVNALIELATRRNPATGRQLGGIRDVANDSLIQSLPQVTLYRNVMQALHGEGKDRIYPPSVRSALLQYLAGGIANPRELNLKAAHKQAQQGR